ncbi:MAG: 4'-phosphopantetheinyl transferase superfamily protein [Hamadaea sp.]|uniref:4'-phosphopantetheinyl transferase family protein n=1 Tax=Hamadaea sp. TaxID=2024425 RepID=UPI0017A27777|nr:4'-phosphopantetheinyl transferase superfamily protein [Hamadaea sp.]NUR74502.1 4'-phosphopantetheinyl transferase superfamily protein [Hamadaea sp.]NUT21431.1 4'-phosphopantetheinyl transferase superfamily protein [Hamadaea sp.]
MDEIWGAPTLPAASAPPAGVCHLWPVPVSSRTSWISDEEWAQADRFVADHARRTFLTSRSSQREIAARYLGIAPDAVTIERTCHRCGGAHGRPTVGESIDLSVTHTREWVVLAVVGQGRIGVDLEQRGTARDLDTLTSTLTPAERAEFAAVPPSERTAWFLRRWTRKEAAVKLTGHGIAVRFDALDTLGPLATGEGVAPDWPAEDIHLTDVRVGGDLVVAVATTVSLDTVVICGPLP